MIKLFEEWFRYDDLTGVLWWRKPPFPNYNMTRPAGTLHKDGYIRIQLKGKLYLAHHIVFVLKMGAIPIPETDHVNRKAADNRWINLRPATRAQNIINQKPRGRSGIKGVNTYPNGYTATINGKYLGFFTSAEDAAKAYETAARAVHREFSPV